MKKLLLLLAPALLTGCIGLDGIWFNGTRLEAYDFPFNQVPDDLLEEVTLESTVDGEEPVNIAGQWLHQCPEANGQAADCGTARDDVKILYFHGNFHSNQEYWDRAQNLWRMEPRPEDAEGYVPSGYPTFIVDYRGYGMSEGDSSEDGFFADGQAAYDHVRSRMDDDDKLIIYGFSIGSAVATETARNNPHDLFMLESALASGQAFIDDAVGVGFDLSVVMETRFDNFAKIPEIDTPKLMMHGRNDDFVRIDFGRLLFDNAVDPKTFFENDGEHGSVPCPERDPDPNLLPSDEACDGLPFYYELIDDFVSSRLDLVLD